MAAQRKIEAKVSAGDARPLALADKAEGLRAAPSPARDLQDRVSNAWVAEQRWSPRKTFLFILASCGGAWSLAALALYRMLG